MGRPLKIAKAQYSLGTITDTVLATGVVTYTPATTNTAFFTVGMPIVVSTTVGGITAGVTYWVLTKPSSTTMTLSQTDLSTNRTATPLPLTDTTGQSVAFTVGEVDSGFNNPAGTANTYGVVGGNTNIFANQVLTRVAIAQNGTGTIMTNPASAIVYGAGTSFATQVVVGGTAQKATGAVVTTSGSGDTTHDYVAGQVLTVTGGTGTAPTFTVAATKIRTIAEASGASATYLPGDYFTFSGAGWTTAAVVTVATVGAGGAITGITVSNPGSYNGAALVDPVTATSQNSVAGTGATWNIGMGVLSVTSLAVGSLTVLPANPASTSVSAGSGLGATLTVSYNAVVSGSAIQAADGTQIGFVSTIEGATTVNVTDTTVTTNLVTCNDTSGLVVNAPIAFSANIGGIVAGSVYYVQSKPSGTTFKVSTLSGDPAMVLSTATGVLTAKQDSLTLEANAAAAYATTAWVYADDEPGYIVRQKGRSKFLVSGSTSGLTGVCYTANLANTALTPSTMSIVATTDAPADVYLERLSDHTAKGFGNTDTATAYYATFNSAVAAGGTNPITNNSQPYAVVSVNKA